MKNLRLFNIPIDIISIFALLKFKVPEQTNLMNKL